MVLLSFRAFKPGFLSVCIRMMLIKMLLCLCMSFAFMLASLVKSSLKRNYSSK